MYHLLMLFNFTLLTVDLKLHIYLRKSLCRLELIDVNSVTEQ